MSIPVVMLHSVTRDRHDFAPFAPHLPGGVHAAPHDLLGHGDAPRASRYRVTDFAEAICLPETPSVLFGHSLGGLVSLELAQKRPDQVSAVVLEDPPLFDSKQPRLDTTPWATGFRKMKALMTGRGAQWSQEDWAASAARWPSGHGRLSTEEAGGSEAVLRRAQQVMRLDPAVIDAMLAPELHDGFDVVDAIRAIRCPITLLAGERSAGSALSDEDLRILAAEPNVTIVRVLGAGHYLREAEPAVCANAVRDAVAAYC